jgi:hypothetical protein
MPVWDRNGSAVSVRPNEVWLIATDARGAVLGTSGPFDKHDPTVYRKGVVSSRAMADVVHVYRVSSDKMPDILERGNIYEGNRFHSSTVGRRFR